jgi:VCBS repeat-containing protein
MDGVTVEATDEPTTANTAPTATADDFTTVTGETLTVPAPGVLGNDTDPDTGDTLQAKQATAPAHGTLTLAADGSFTYVPTRGFTGDDRFSYTTTDSRGAVSTAGTVTIHVTAASAATQRLTVVGRGKGAAVLVSGPVTAGTFTVTPTTGRPTGVSGTGTITTANRRVYTVTITASTTRGSTSTVKISEKGKVVATFTGTGTLVRTGKLVSGGFASRDGRFGFVLRSR